MILLFLYATLGAKEMSFFLTNFTYGYLVVIKWYHVWPVGCVRAMVLILLYANIFCF